MYGHAIVVRVLPRSERVHRILVKLSVTKFNENLSTVFGDVHAEGQTDGNEEGST
jgi:hypothetical protein